jgi:prolyl 4-hydroxylase
MHHDRVSTNYPWLPHNIDPERNPIPDEHNGTKIQPLGNVKERYEKFMNGCVDYWGEEKGQLCIANEKSRIEMSTNQPRSMRNFTDTGFKKIRAPAHVYTLLKEFWDKNHMKEKNESWRAGNIYT